MRQSACTQEGIFFGPESFFVISVFFRLFFSYPIVDMSTAMHQQPAPLVRDSRPRHQNNQLPPTIAGRAARNHYHHNNNNNGNRRPANNPRPQLAPPNAPTLQVPCVHRPASYNCTRCTMPVEFTTADCIRAMPAVCNACKGNTASPTMRAYCKQCNALSLSFNCMFCRAPQCLLHAPAGESRCAACLMPRLVPSDCADCDRISAQNRIASTQTSSPARLSPPIDARAPPRSNGYRRAPSPPRRPSPTNNYYSNGHGQPRNQSPPHSSTDIHKNGLKRSYHDIDAVATAATVAAPVVPIDYERLQKAIVDELVERLTAKRILIVKAPREDGELDDNDNDGAAATSSSAAPAAMSISTAVAAAALAPPRKREDDIVALLTSDRTRFDDDDRSYNSDADDVDDARSDNMD